MSFFIVIRCSLVRGWMALSLKSLYLVSFLLLHLG